MFQTMLFFFREKKPKLDATGVTGDNMKIPRQQSSCTNALVDTQHMSVSHGRLEYTISDHTASNVSAKTSTPFFPAEPRPNFSCTAIGNLHDSEMQQADATQQLACDSKNLSTIQEQSGESSSDTFRKSSSSSSRGFSEGSESNIDAICSIANRHLQNTPPVFVNDEVAKGSKPENKSVVNEDNILKKFAEAETSHVEAALHSLTLNAGLSNVSISGRSFTSKPVDVSGSKAITAIVKTMEFEIYPNLTFETEKSLNERFFVNSKVLLGMLYLVLSSFFMTFQVIKVWNAKKRQAVEWILNFPFNIALPFLIFNIKGTRPMSLQAL